ncbi:MAG: hypothetical protein KME12_05045 [Trichocoleus desertorum ATA4-8-CV12]|nr:hypothetical protein [Trichocoleus desertorum ATA4-8-CV12]
MAALVLNYSVDVPVGDQWWTTQTIIKAMNGTITFGDLLAQHNESRKFFPRLVDIALAYLTKYDVRAEMFLSILLSCVISLSLIWLSYVTISQRRIVICALALITNLLLFSPIQYEAWLNGLSNVVYLSLACITSGLVIATTSLHPGIKLGICAVLATISTFSFANGILAWIIIFPALYSFTGSSKFLEKIWLVLGWFLIAALNLVVYFYDYHKPGYHPSLLTAVWSPGKAIVYFLSFLGNPLAWGTVVQTPNQATIVGLVLLVLYCLLGLNWLRSCSKLGTRQQEIIWLSLGAYGIVSAAITTVGRVGFSTEQALASRYSTFAIYLFISVIHLIALFISQKNLRVPSYSTILNHGITILVTTFILLHGFTFIYSISQMQQMRQERLFAKTCLLFINSVPDASCVERSLYWGAYFYGFSFGGINYLQPVANSANRLGLLNPPLLSTNRLINSSTNSNIYGYFDAFSLQGNKEYVASGWAVLPQLNRPADTVLLTYDLGQGATVFKVIKVGDARPDVVKLLGVQTYLRSGWSDTFSMDKPLPPNTKIEAWAFDVETTKAYKLGTPHQTMP